MKRILSLFLAVLLVFSLAGRGEAYMAGEPFRMDLSNRIQDPDRRAYVEMMLDYYLRTDTMVQHALAGGFSAMFLFDGASDKMDDPELEDFTYYRATGICLILKLNAQGEPELTYFNDSCSTIPDRPLEYGAWALPEVGEVGPATICDGTYQTYSVRHKGKYEALNLRTEYYDALIDAVYMTPEGYVGSRASEINIHTRTSNHTSGTSMWSAGCPLVGGGKSWEFWKMMYAMYYSLYDEFELDNFLGTVTIDRMLLKERLYELYLTKDAVDVFMARTWKAQPERYLDGCTGEEDYKRSEEKRLTMGTQLMSLPCSNATDARSVLVSTLPEGETVNIVGSIRNSAGNLWYRVEIDGKTGYVYSGHVEKDSFADWLFKTLFT